MYEHYKEAALPITYRRREITCITTALAMQRSVQVVGLTGMGKSNLLRFLVSHPQLLKNSPHLLADDIYFVYIDCNKLNPVSSLNFYRACCSRLQTKVDPAAGGDEYLVYQQLEQTLRALERQTFVILVVDRAETLYEQASRAFFSQLRNLRDEARGGLMAFVFGSQRPVGDFYALEKLFSDTCWVGPLAEADRAEFFARHEGRLKIKVAEPWQKVLWRLTGGHPGFLKNSLERLKRRGIDNLPEDEVGLTQDLLKYAPMQKHCRGLWENLTEAEQNLLRDINSGISRGEGPINELKQSGLIVDEGHALKIFSPLWQAYLVKTIWSKQKAEPMQLQLDPARRRVILHWRGQSAKTTITRGLVFDLLQILSSVPGKLFTKEELMQAIYKDEKAYEVMDDALFQLITALRKSVDVLVKQLCPAMTESCIQNVRGVGYRLVLALPVETAGDAARQ